MVRIFFPASAIEKSAVALNQAASKQMLFRFLVDEIFK